MRRRQTRGQHWMGRRPQDDRAPAQLRVLWQGLKSWQRPRQSRRAYSALESEIRVKALSEGFDPTIGIMHEGSDGSSKFVFDLMEPERPKVDRAVLEFVKGHVFDPAAFVIRSDGVCRLNPEMARMVVVRVST
jgi:CRISPR associated protein Cas1